MVEVLKTGLYDTIQDLGRFGVQQYGIPFSGVMDLYSAKLANTILNNLESDAVLEITMSGPKLQFHCDTVIALTGADLSPKLNAREVKMNTRIRVCKNDVLSFGAPNYGCRTYLAVFGGFQTDCVMNSYSMYNEITKQSKLNKGDHLLITEIDEINETTNASLKISKSHFEVNDIEVLRGIEFNSLSASEQNTLLSTEFSISINSNRMAYQVNEAIKNSIKPMITSLVLPGTVQLTPSGKLIILMRDCQTTGGYPRVLQVSEASINRLSQKIFGEKFRFKCID